MGKYVKWGLVVLLVFYVATQPAAAAGVVHSAIGGLKNIATGASAFVTGVGSNL